MFHAGIRFLLVPCLLWPWDPGNTTLWRDSFPAVIPDRFLMLDESQSPLSVAGQFPFTGEDPGYHMSAAGQRRIADNYLERWPRSRCLNWWPVPVLTGYFCYQEITHVTASFFF